MSTSYRDFGFDYPPFADTVDPQFLFPSSGVRQAWNCLDGYMQSGRDVIFLLGGPGMGKTLLYRDLLENQWCHIPFALITNPHLQPVEMLTTICDDLGIKYPLERPEASVLWEKLREFMVARVGGRGDKKVMLIVDEAHDLTEGALETLYRLHQLGKEMDSCLRILLVGQPETVEIVRGTLIPQTSGDTAVAQCHLGPLSKSETIAYIHYRLKIAGGKANLFTRGALLTAYHVAEGVPRVLNILCDHALHEAQAHSSKKITARLIRLSASKYLKGKPAESSWDLLPDISLESITSMLNVIRKWFRFRRDRVPSLPSPTSPADENIQDVTLQSQEPISDEPTYGHSESGAIITDKKEIIPSVPVPSFERAVAVEEEIAEVMEARQVIPENESPAVTARSDASLSSKALEGQSSRDHPATSPGPEKKETRTTVAAPSLEQVVAVEEIAEVVETRQTLLEEESFAVTAPVVASRSAKTLESRSSEKVSVLKGWLGGSGKKKPAPVPPPGMVFIDAMELCSAYLGRTIPIGPFFLDRTPVTYADYSHFLEDTNHPPPHDWFGNKPSPRLLRCPVVNISLEDARSYAAWRGKRLPTFLEWECAARRPDNRRFPWGDQWEPSRCNHPGAALGKLTEVDAYPEGSSVDGCLDLVGNTWEWTELPEDAQLSGVDLPEPGYHWVMGGSFRHACNVGGTIARTAVLVTQRYRFLGFRCAQEVK